MGFPCFSFCGGRRGEIVSGNKKALTSRWHRGGVRDRGGSVVVMCSVDMYSSLRDIARGSGAVMRGTKIGGEGVTAVAGKAGTSVAGSRTKRTSALDRSTEMGEPIGAVGGGDSV